MNVTEEFCRYLSERGLSQSSLGCYGKDAESFFAYLSQHKLRFVDVTSEDLAQWVSFLGESGDAPNTVGRRIAAIRRLFNYAYDAGKIEHNPALVLKTVRRKTPIVREENLELAKTILRSIEQYRDCIRDNVIVTLAAIAGFRTSEIISLTMKSFDLTSEGLLVTAPTWSKRTVHLSGACSEPVVRYWIQRREEKADPDAPFLLGRKHGTLSRQAIWKALKRRSAQLGLPHTIGPTLLRGLFIQKVIHQDASLKTKAFAAGLKDPLALKLYQYQRPNA